MRLFIVLLLPVESVVKERTAETAGQEKTAIVQFYLLCYDLIVREKMPEAPIQRADKVLRKP